MTEPIELYLDAEKDFFHEPHSAMKAGIYKDLLLDHREYLNRVLSNGNKTKGPLAEIANQLKVCAGFERKHSTFLRKPSDEGPLTITIEELCEAAGVELTMGQREYVTGKVHSHLARLVFPERYTFELINDPELAAKVKNTTCRRFGLDFIRYVATLKDHPSVSPFKEGIGSQGDGATMFWTYAPYTHLDLIKREFDKMRSIREIYKWVREAAERKTDERSAELQITHFDPTPCNLTNSIIQLGYDERMPSHLLTRILAKTFAIGL